MKKRKVKVSPIVFGLIFLLAILITIAISITQVSYKPMQLSELQITACNAAHDAGNCNTRLADIGIVLAEDCCEALGKCCK
jgi:hypothetical protein